MQKLEYERDSVTPRCPTLGYFLLHQTTVEKKKLAAI
jgi:hypothetical protein